MSSESKAAHALLFWMAFLPPLLLSSLPALAQSAYRWVDEKGVIHFTDDPGNIPAEYRQRSAEARKQESSKLIEEPAAESGAEPIGEGKAEGVVGQEEARAQAAEAEAPEAKISPYEKATEQLTSDVDKIGHDRTYWQDRRRYWEKRLEGKRLLHAETRRQFNLLNQRFDKKEYKDMKALRERIRELEAEIAQAEEMLGGGLAREARKAGAPQGWVR